MNRRNFTRGLLSLGLTPSISLPAIGGSSTGAMAAAATADKMYFVGWYTAKMAKTCSPEVLVSELNVDGGVAREICNRLVNNGTISAPDALGISRTLDPIDYSTRRVRREAAKRLLTRPADPLSSDQPIKDTLEKTKRIVMEDPQEEDLPDEACEECQLDNTQDP